MRKADLVLVPTDAEGALECAALAPLVEALDLSVEIRVLRAEDRGLLPSTLLGSSRLGVLDQPVDGALHVVFASTGEPAAAVARAAGKERVVQRLTGVDTFRVFRRGFTRRYRQGAGLLLRSRLEMAEIAESSCDRLPSGVRYAPTTGAAPEQRLAVYVPPAAVALPALEAWVSSVTGQLSGAGIELTLLGGPQVAARLPAFRFTELLPHAPLSTVVLPVCDEVALLEARGASCVLFDPGYTAEEFSPPWRAAHPVAQTIEEVTARLASPPASVPDAWAAELSRLDEPELDAPAWAEQLVGILESRGHLKRSG